MGKSTGELRKKAVARRLSADKCKEPGCGKPLYVVKGNTLTRCAKHAQEHDDREAERKKYWRERKKCSKCKEHRPLAPGLATCSECAGLTDDVVEDMYPMDASKQSKIRSYAKMSREKAKAEAKASLSELSSPVNSHCGSDSPSPLPAAPGRKPAAGDPRRS